MLLKNFTNLFYKIQNYQDGEESMRGSEFVRHSIDLLYYHLQKISLKRVWWHIDSPKWLKNKKTTVNPKNNNDDCFQYAWTVALHCQKIKNNPKRISKIKPFIDQQNWKEIASPSE